MKKYKVTYDRPNCIGAGVCVFADPKHWAMANDGKADLALSQKKGDSFELIIDETELSKMMDAAQSCPVNVIHIDDIETGKRLI